MDEDQDDQVKDYVHEWEGVIVHRTSFGLIGGGRR